MPIDPTARVACPHAGKCPGCPLIDLSYGDQLARKRERVGSALSSFPELSSISVDETAPADGIVGYRARAKLAVEGTHVGLYAKGTHEVVDIPECRVLPRDVLDAVGRVRGALPLEVPLRAIDVRVVDGGQLLTLVVPSGVDLEPVARTACELARSDSRLLGVAASFRDERSQHLLGGWPTRIVGVERARCATGFGSSYYYATYGAFAQAHSGQERALLLAVTSAIAEKLGRVEGMSVLELFSGAGALSLSLTALGAKVRSVEAFGPAVELARAAAREQRLELVAEEGNAAERAHEFRVEEERFDVVVANPPRRGLESSLREAIAALSPRLLVYVSCEPATLSRDLADFARRGLAGERLLPFDMMPLTDEVETLAVLSPAKVPDPVVLFSDDRLIAVDKAPHEPTIPQGEHVHSLLERVRRLPNAERAVPVHRLDIGTSGVCLFARTEEHAGSLARALAQGEKRYTVLVRGITRPKGSVQRALVDRRRHVEARTRYARREIVGGHSILSVRPDEGKKHQIRRHLSSIDHPVVGDARYGDPRTNHHFAMRHLLDRPFLHCSRIRIDHGGRELELRAPLSADLSLVLASLAETGHGEDGDLD